MFTFNINSIYIILICICLIISNILLRREIKKLKDEMNSKINSSHIRINNVNYIISGSISRRLNSIENNIAYIFNRLR